MRKKNWQGWQRKLNSQRENQKVKNSQKKTVAQNRRIATNKQNLRAMKKDVTVTARIDWHTSELLAEYVSRTKRDIQRGTHRMTDPDVEAIIGGLIRIALTTNQQDVLRRLERIEKRLNSK
jgi:hypothetical protein